VLYFCKDVPYLLVGCQKDLRTSQKEIEKLHKTSRKQVTVEQGEEVRKRIRAKQYLECSSLTGEGVNEVFEAAVRHSNNAIEIRRAKREANGWRRAARPFSWLGNKPAIKISEKLLGTPYESMP
jgi:GTPase SAR1 family protein